MITRNTAQIPPILKRITSHAILSVGESLLHIHFVYNDLTCNTKSINKITYTTKASNSISNMHLEFRKKSVRSYRSFDDLPLRFKQNFLKFRDAINKIRQCNNSKSSIRRQTGTTFGLNREISIRTTQIYRYFHQIKTRIPNLKRTWFLTIIILDSF